MILRQQADLLRPRQGWVLLFTLGSLSSVSGASTAPTLEELKEIGSRESTYRNRSIPAVTTAAPEPGLAEFRMEVSPILKEHCVTRHGPEKTKANLRIDTLDPNLLEGGDVDWWLEVMAVLSNGEMPPPEDSELPDDDGA